MRCFKSAALDLTRGEPITLTRGDASNSGRKIAREGRQAASPETRARPVLKKTAAPERRTPKYLAKFLPEEITRWTKVVQDAGIPVE